MNEKQAKKHKKHRLRRALAIALAVFIAFLFIFIILNVTGVNAPMVYVGKNLKAVTPERVEQGLDRIELKKEDYEYEDEKGNPVKTKYWTIYSDQFDSVVDVNDPSKKEKTQVKVLQLTDVHVGGGFMSIFKDSLTINAVKEMVEWSKPDVIYITGDLLYPIPIGAGNINNLKAARAFVKMMNTFEIPWTMVFGNHDTESFALADKKELSQLFEENSYDPNRGTYCLYQRGPEFEKAKGSSEYSLGNYLIMIKDKTTKKLVHTSIFMDSNRYYSKSGGITAALSFFSYDWIRENQIKWYNQQIKMIKKHGGNDTPSSLFFHIPLPEYKKSWIELAGNKRFIFNPVKDKNGKYTPNKIFENKPGQVKYFGGDMQETFGDKNGTKIVISSSKDEFFKDANKIYDAVKESNSTKFLFCGHDHDNNFSIETKEGVRLTFGKSIDYLAYPGISKRTFQRGATEIFITNQKSDKSIKIYEKKLVNLKNKQISEYNTPKETVENVRSEQV